MKYVITITITVLVLFGGFVFLTRPQEVSCGASHSFYIQENFDTVRKTLVRTTAKTEIWEATNIKVVEEKFEKVDFDLKRKNWMLDVNGSIKLKIKNNNLGTLIVPATEKIHINPDTIDVVLESTQPISNIHKMKTITKISRHGNITKVDVTMESFIHYRAPSLKYIKAKVEKMTFDDLTNTLKSMEQSFPKAIQKHKSTTLVNIF